MSCYHPLIAVPKNKLTENKKQGYNVIGAAENYDTMDLHFLAPDGYIKVPCGKCIGCRLDKSREWADRMLLEYDHTKKAVFLTLTFRSEEMAKKIGIDPEYSIRDHLCYDDGEKKIYTILKTDSQKFMKDLRGRKEFEDKKLRFFSCGEYGSKRDRPHYHFIIFGITKEDFGNIILCGFNKFNDPIYRSPLLEEIWPYGISSIEDTSWKTFAYVARYVTKKLNGPLSAIYAEENKVQEFCLMSRRPGIGAMYLEDHDFDFTYSSISLSDGTGSKTIGVPKYFLKKLETIDPEMYHKLKEQRKQFTEDRELLKLFDTDLGIEGVLRIEEERKIESANVLRRPLEQETNLY